jgi:hypothetical protein
MSEEKRRPGRPRVRIERGVPAEYVGFRASKALKASLELEAQKSGRSLSTEAQFRLEQSLADNKRATDILLPGLTLKYGAPLAHLLLAVADAMHEVGTHRYHTATAAMPRADWPNNPDAYQAAEEVAIVLLATARPAAPPAGTERGHMAGEAPIDEIKAALAGAENQYTPIAQHVAAAQGETK